MYQIPPKKEYLKVDELKTGRTYTCRLSGKVVFIRSVTIINIMGQEAIEGIYYDLGRYRIAEYFDYMLY